MQRPLANIDSFTDEGVSCQGRRVEDGAPSDVVLGRAGCPASNQGSHYHEQCPNVVHGDPLSPLFPSVRRISQGYGLHSLKKANFLTSRPARRKIARTLT